jgi:hypothetical protein
MSLVSLWREDYTDERAKEWEVIVGRKDEWLSNIGSRQQVQGHAYSNHFHITFFSSSQ